MKQKERVIFIDGAPYKHKEGETILTVAQRNGIYIPTLCFNKLVCASGACGICVCEDERTGKLIRVCATECSQNAKILTNSKKTIKTRKSVIELMMSTHSGDCVAPCQLACPANTDCQSYIGFVKDNLALDALKIIKDKIPLPLSIGRICPHPCEDKCRRALVDEPIAICSIKQFAADKGYIRNINTPNKSGKTVAIVGGGPAGLSCAYYLSEFGHKVTVFDKMPKMGGMLRYGVPEYRLPKSILDKDIKIVKNKLIVFENNKKLGKDIFIEKLKAEFNAVVLAVGASKGVTIKIDGQEKEGVLSGIEFLKEVSAASKKAQFSSITTSHIKDKVVAVVGGGDTAIDACRTAIRLGASVVYNIYRRDEKQMPASKIEIKEAKEEGVVFKFLVNPIKLLGEKRVERVVLQKMRLAEKDETGRQSFQAIVGETENLKIDTLITMIGQTVCKDGLQGVGFSNKGTIYADEKTFQAVREGGSNSEALEGVFAIGDATNKGASIAIEAIAEAKSCALVVHEFIKKNKIIKIEKPFFARDNKTEENYNHIKKEKRQQQAELSPAERTTNFFEVKKPLTKQQAEKEASRCLGCGCSAVHDCKLLQNAQELEIEENAIVGEKACYNIDSSKEYFYKDLNKCILCGLCVAACDKTKSEILAIAERGFNAHILTESGLPLEKTNCTACGNCVSVCPTGALRGLSYSVRLKPTNTTNSFCLGCANACRATYKFHKNRIIKLLPLNNQLLCKDGAFLQGFIPNLVDNNFLIASAISKFQPQDISACLCGTLSNEAIDDALSLCKNYNIKKIYTSSSLDFSFEEGQDESLNIPIKVKAAINARKLIKEGIQNYSEEKHSSKITIHFLSGISKPVPTDENNKAVYYDCFSYKSSYSIKDGKNKKFKVG